MVSVQCGTTDVKNRRKKKGVLGAIAVAVSILGGSFAVAAENYVQNGVAFYEEGDYKSALAEYDKAIEYNPEDAAAYYERARIYCMTKLDDLALADAEKAIALNPEFALAYEMRAYAKSAQTNYEGAIADINQAIALQPENALWYVVRGEIYGEQGNLAQFRIDLDKGMEDPKALEKLKEIDSFGRGILHCAKDAAADDAVHYNNFYIGVGGDGGTYNLDSIAHYTHILEVNPNAETVRYKRGRCYADQKEYEKATADFTEAIAISPDNPEYYEQRAWCYHCLGREEAADVDMEKAKAYRTGRDMA